MNPWAVTAGLFALYCISKSANRKGGRNEWRVYADYGGGQGEEGVDPIHPSDWIAENKALGLEIVASRDYGWILNRYEKGRLISTGETISPESALHPTALTAENVQRQMEQVIQLLTGSQNTNLPTGLVPGLEIRILDQDALSHARELETQRIDRLRNLTLKPFDRDRSPSLKTRRAYDWTAFKRENPEIEFYSDLTLVPVLTPYAESILANWQHFSPRENRNLEEHLREFKLGENLSCTNPNILRVSGAVSAMSTPKRKMSTPKRKMSTHATDKKLNLRTRRDIPWTKKKIKAIKKQITAPTDLIHFLEYHSVPYEVVPEAATPLDLWHCQQ